MRRRSTTTVTCWPTAASGLPEATDLVKRALAEDPQNGAYLDSLGWAYYKQGRLPEAEEALRKAVDTSGTTRRSSIIWATSTSSVER